MYKIIGADQKEYGPVTTEQLRQWMAEGRVNGQTSVKAEGTTEWKPLAAFPEFADLLGATPAGTSTIAAGEHAVVPAEVILGRDYDLDIGNCISRSWELVKKHFGPIVGISFLVLLIIGVVNQMFGLVTRPVIREMITERRISLRGVAIILATSVLSTPVYVVFIAGLFKYYLKLIRRESAGIADAFSGLSSAPGQLVLLGLAMTFLSLIGYCFCVLPGIYLIISWVFAVPLVFDRRMGFWEAMEFSRKVVGKHWFLILGLQLVCGLIAACGVIACCIGILVTVPIGWVALMYAYEDIFGRPAA